MFYDTHTQSYFLGSHHGRHGHGHAHGRGGGFMRGGPGMPAARKLGSGDLQLVILALLADQPAHGYELIKRLEEHSGGFYTPSPGMIYPALTYLDEVGYAAAEPDGTRKCYHVTEAGQAHLAANRAAADAILAALARVGGRMDEVREAFAGATGPDNPAYEALHRARHALKAALGGAHGGTTDHMLRVAAILDRATAEIRALGEPS